MIVTLRCPLTTTTYNAQWIECNTSVGNFVIQKGHAPMMLALSAGKPLTVLLADNKLKRFTITTTGFVEVTPQKITILLPALHEIS